MSQIKFLAVLLFTLVVSSCSPSKLARTEVSFPNSAALTSTNTPEVTSQKYANVSFDFAENEIHVKNNSNTSAKNLRVWLCIVHVNNNWQNLISGVSSLKFKVESGLLQFSQEYSKHSNCVKSLDEQDTDSMLFKFESLPPNKNLSVLINKPEPIENLVQETYEGKFFINTRTDLLGKHDGIQLESAIFNKFTDSLIYQLEKGWAIIDLKLRIECENCLSSEENISVAFRDNMNINDCKIVAQNNDSIVESCLFWFLYSTPKHSGELLPKKENRYFTAIQNNTNYNSLVEIPEKQFQESMT